MKIILKENNNIKIQYSDDKNNLYDIDFYIKDKNEVVNSVNLMIIGYFFNGGNTKLIYCKNFIISKHNKNEFIELCYLPELSEKIVELIAHQYLH
jgi:hypothetical protein